MARWPLPQACLIGVAVMAFAALAACAPDAGPGPRGKAPGAGKAGGAGAGGAGTGRAGIRVISLNPCTDAILAEVADPGQILALSRYSRDPGQSSMDVRRARQWPATDGSLEEVMAYRPQLVLSGGFTPPATAAAMARLGLPLVEVGIADTVPASFAQIRRIAALVGHADRGDALVARISAQLAAVAPPPGFRPIPALVWEGGGLAPGQGTLMDDLLARTGFRNMARGTGGAMQAVPLETVIADPPAVLLPVMPDGAVADQDRLLAHPVLAHLAGMQRFALDPALQWCGGPSILRAAARLAAIRQAMGKGPGRIGA